jgi:hypothetical protein
MERRKIEKDLIFYSPGKPGSIFTYKAGHFITDTDIHEMQEHLKYDTGKNIACVEERRGYERPRISTSMS